MLGDYTQLAVVLASGNSMGGWQMLGDYTKPAGNFTTFSRQFFRLGALARLMPRQGFSRGLFRSLSSRWRGRGDGILLFPFCNENPKLGRHPVFWLISFSIKWMCQAENF